VSGLPMIGSLDPDLLTKAQEALAASRGLKLEVEAHDANANRVRKDVEAAQAERKRISSGFADRAARALADGEELPEPPERDLKKIAKLNRTIEAGEDALLVVRDDQGKSSAAYLQARVAASNAVLALLVEIRLAQVGVIRAALVDLAPTLALLAATDSAEASLLGPNFPLSQAVPLDLFSGEFFAKKFVEPIPKRLRPELLSDPEFTSATAEAAAQLHQIVSGASQ
jgi:hypothetical protein